MVVIKQYFSKLSEYLTIKATTNSVLIDYLLNLFTIVAAINGDEYHDY
jgi:hypothetical protein